MLRQLTGPGAPAAALRGGRGAGALRYARVLVAALAVTQTVGYGVLYYSFSVFLAPMAQALHATTTAVTGALTLSLLVGAAAAVPVGRWLDRRGGRLLMSAGSILGTLLVAALSQIHSLAALYLVWAGIGLVSAMVLYEAAFAVIIPFFSPGRRNSALLAVTIVAGFASSIFLPLCGALLAAYGWRTAILVLALVHGVITIPLHLLVRRPAVVSDGGGVVEPADPAAREYRRVLVRGALRDLVFWALGVGFTAQGAGVAAVSVLLVSALRSFGHTPGFAAGCAGLLGVLSVTGRLAFTLARRRTSPAVIAAVVFVVQASGAGLVPFLGRSSAGAVGCVLAFGLGLGVATLTRPALVADRYGAAAFATLSGVMAVPLTIVKALAPLGAAALAVATGSYTPVMLATALACLLGAVGLLAATWGGFDGCRIHRPLSTLTSAD